MQKRLPKQNSKIVKNAFTKSVLTKPKVSKITKIQQRDEDTTMSKIVIISFSKTTFTTLKVSKITKADSLPCEGRIRGGGGGCWEKRGLRQSAAYL